MKNVIVILSFLFALPVYAEGFYVGGSYGYSNLNYDLEGEAWEYIGTDKTASQINAVIQTLDGNVSVDAKKGSSFSKAFVGYRFNKYFGLEVFQAKMQNYKLAIDADARYRYDIGASDRHGNTSAYIDGNISLAGNATADFNGFGLRANGYIPITKNLEMLVGFGIMSVKSNITTSYRIDGEWSAGADAEIYGRRSPFPATSGGYSTSTGTGGTYQDYSNDTDNLDGYSPVLSLGMMYNFTENFSVRGELEWYGIPVDGLSIIATSVGAQYNF